MLMPIKLNKSNIKAFVDVTSFLTCTYCYIILKMCMIMTLVYHYYYDIAKILFKIKLELKN